MSGLPPRLRYRFINASSIAIHPLSNPGILHQVSDGVLLCSKARLAQNDLALKNPGGDPLLGGLALLRGQGPLFGGPRGGTPPGGGGITSTTLTLFGGAKK